MIFYLFLGAFDSEMNMNNQISSNINGSDPGQQFPECLWQLRNWVETDQSPAAIAESNQLQLLFNQLLQSADPDAGYQMRSSLTEIHRLLRLLQRDLIFWQTAKQTKAGRKSQVLATLQSIENFYQLLSLNAGEI
jgi:hypothetical protein